MPRTRRAAPHGRAERTEQRPKYRFLGPYAAVRSMLVSAPSVPLSVGSLSCPRQAPFKTPTTRASYAALVHHAEHLERPPRRSRRLSRCSSSSSAAGDPYRSFRVPGFIVAFIKSRDSRIDLEDRKVVDPRNHTSPVRQCSQVNAAPATKKTERVRKRKEARSRVFPTRDSVLSVLPVNDSRSRYHVVR